MGNPNLLTAQQHRFVLAIIEGKTQAEAYKAARFPTGSKPLANISTKHAGRKGAEMARAAPVREALAGAQEASLMLAATNLASLVADLQEARAVALASDPPQTNGAVAASMGIAKLLGLVVDRAKVDVVQHKPGFSSKQLELSEEEWKRQFDRPALGKSVGKTKHADR